MDNQQRLEQIAQRYRDQGYQVTLNPGPDDLPPFAKDFKVEILAARPDGNVLTSVKGSATEFETDPDLSRYAEAIEEQPGWRYDVYALGPPPMPKSLSELRALEAKIQKTLDKILPATVGVGSGGSGVVVSKDGLIVSVAHVTQKAGREVQITFPDGKRAKAKTLGNYKSADASLLKLVDEGPWPYVDMGKSTR